MTAYSVMSLSSPSVLLVNLERVLGTRRGGWGVGAGVGKAVPVSVTTLGISSSSSVAGGFSSHSLYLNTEVQLVLGPYGAVSSWGICWGLDSRFS